MRRILVARTPTWWRRVPLIALAIAAQLLLGVIALALRTARVIVTVIAEIAIHAERQLAAHTGRPALSQTGIAALTAAFVHEFRTAYHQPTTR